MQQWRGEDDANKDHQSTDKNEIVIGHETTVHDKQLWASNILIIFRPFLQASTHLECKIAKE